MVYVLGETQGWGLGEMIGSEELEGKGNRLQIPLGVALVLLQTSEPTPLASPHAAPWPLPTHSPSASLADSSISSISSK